VPDVASGQSAQWYWDFVIQLWFERKRDYPLFAQALIA